MKSPLIYDQGDFKWNLLGDILKIFDSRRSRQEMAEQGIKLAGKSVMMLKIVLIAIFFSRNISYVLKELETKVELRKFADIHNVPSNEDLSRFISQYLLMNSLLVWF